ncbi:MAG TPA: WG repeat-containing protein [Candidatus Melainabacteria bacterium]|nr:WG repeat-containing protein [Candidatus Melainabacteria bacterium]HIN65359.1 WG repeat-containing protein [Candidatus Obscuribacterales bacterium]
MRNELIFSAMLSALLLTSLPLARGLAVGMEGAAQTVSSEQKEPDLPTGLRSLDRQDEYLIVDGPGGRGVCSTSGNLLIPANFGDIRYVGDDLFAARNYRDDGSTAWWLLNSKGQTVAKLPDWTRIDSNRFCEGLLSIGDSYSPTAFIDKSGKIVLNFDQYTDVKNFSEGLAAASYSDRNGRAFGFVDHRGKMVIGPFKNGEVTKFENGLAVVSSFEGGKLKSGVVSSKGKFIVPMIYDGLSSIGDGKFWAHRDNRVVFLDSQGKVLVKLPDDCTSASPPDKFEPTTWIACGFGGKVNKSINWGYCDMKGKVVISPRFPLCSSFKGNRAVAYTKNGRDGQVCGVIDRQGNWVVEPKYRYISIIDDSHWSLGELATGEVAKVANKRFERALNFQQVLKDGDLIGMPLLQFEELVGKVDSPSYLPKATKVGVKISQLVLVDSMCGPGSVVMQVATDENDKITGWRALEGGITSGSQPWITENVFLEDSRKGLQLGNLVPKK